MNWYRKIDEKSVSNDRDDEIKVRVINTTNFHRPTGVAKRCGFLSIQTFNVIMLGVSFCLLFTAFTPSQVLHYIYAGFYSLT